MSKQQETFRQLLIQCIVLIFSIALGGGAKYYSCTSVSVDEENPLIQPIIGTERNFEELWRKISHEYDWRINGFRWIPKVNAMGEKVWLQNEEKPSFAWVSYNPALRLYWWKELVQFAKNDADLCCFELIKMWKKGPYANKGPTSKAEDIIPFLVLEIKGVPLENAVEKVRKINNDDHQPLDKVCEYLVSSEIFLQLIPRESKKY